MRSVVPTLHRTASCFKLGFPGVRELRPSQQAPGIAVRVSLRRRERSSDVPCSEPTLQGSYLSDIAVALDRFCSQYDRDQWLALLQAALPDLTEQDAQWLVSFPA